MSSRSSRRALLVEVVAMFATACTGRRPPRDEAGYEGLSSAYDDAAYPETGDAGAGYDGAARDEGGGLAGAMRRVPVVMFMTSWCPHCSHARRWLDGHGYRYELRDVDRDARAADALEAINPRGAVPTFVVEDRVVIGFNARRLEAVVRDAALARSR